MSFHTYLKTTRHLLSSLISVFRPMPSLEVQAAVLDKMEETNGGKLYVENVRAFLGISTDEAEQICEQGVANGIFERKVAILCKNDGCRRVIGEISAKTLQAEVVCENCHDLGEEDYAFEVEGLDKLPYYTLNTYGK